MDGEPEFDSHQVDLLLAAAELEADMGPYGQPYREAMSEDANLGRDDGVAPKYFYRVPPPSVNYAVRAVDEAREAFQRSLPEGAEMPKGLVFRVQKVIPGSATS